MRRVKLIIYVIIIMMVPLIVQAQPDFPDDVQDVPLDGGVVLLLAGGIAYGAKKYRARKANDSDRAAY